MDVTAVGPDMWLGKVGHFLIILAFVSAILSAISYWVNTLTYFYSKSDSWKSIGKTAFYVHALSLLSAVFLLFYMMATKKYQYAYVYQHASNDLPFKFLFSAFWEGQEGSTLLWAFWHVVLGLILTSRLKKWESPVLGTITLVQSFLVSMLLGVYFFGHKLGISPFGLLRSMAVNAPIFQQNPNFVPQNGTGLNELLRNYWMVIHPPTVFLGFAAVTVPFAFAIGGLVWRKLTEWITPALPWALLAGGVLGLGVLMGGAWAYEALSFGGFWVWDPVENASLVPWLLIVSALHLMLVFRATKYSGLATFLLTILAFILVAYSTFLTKSGVLGESSVHSFTDMGMSGQLIVFILFFWMFSFLALLSSSKNRLIFIIGSLLIYIMYLLSHQAGFSLVAFLVFSFAMLFTISDFPKQKEEKLWTREFWMFVGSLVLLLSALHIIAATSVPVYNKLFHTNFATYDKHHFDSVQLIPAVLISLLSGVVLYFSYKKESKFPYRRFLWPVVLASIFSLVISLVYHVTNPLHVLLLWSSWFSVFANGAYLMQHLQSKHGVEGSSLAHLGFGLLLAGIVVSQSKKTVITKNVSGQVNVFDQDDELNQNNIMLYENEPMVFGHYKATFRDDVEGKLRNGVIIDFEEYDDNFKKKREFTLMPKYKEIQENTLTADPAIRRGLFEDFFTHLSLINLGTDIDSTKFETLQFKEQDTIQYDRVLFILNDLQQGTSRALDKLQTDDVVVSARMELISNLGKSTAEPVYAIRGNQVITISDSIPSEKMEVRIQSIQPDTGEVEIGIRSARPFRKYVLLKAMIFPLINLVWLGTILMFIGFIISMIQRTKQAKSKN